jgi:hypothetical protein
MNHPRRLIAGVATLALAASAAVVAVRARAGDAPPGSSAVAAAATPTTTPGELTAAETAVRKRAIDKLLSGRAKAVLGGDLQAFLAPVDAKQAELVARQRLLFVNLRKFGFSSLNYLMADTFDPVARLTAKYGPTTFSTRVMMRYQIAGLDPKPVQTDVGYTFVQRSGAWVLVEDNASEELLSADGHRQPWDFQEVSLVRRGKVVVVVDKKEAALGGKIAKVAGSAVSAVRRHWARPWNGAVLVVAMPDSRVMATLWTTGRGSGWTIAAKAVTLYQGEQLGKPVGVPIGSRIVVNPALRKNLDKDLLVHEMTHVATATLGIRAPIWIVEGLAEYVRCRAIEDDPHWTVDPYRKTVRSKYLPKLTAIPDNDLFDADADRAYGSSWWFVEYLASKLGEKGVASLYADLAQHGSTDAVLVKHTGKTSAELVAAVKKFRG